MNPTRNDSAICIVTYASLVKRTFDTAEERVKNIAKMSTATKSTLLMSANI